MSVAVSDRSHMKGDVNRLSDAEEIKHAVFQVFQDSQSSIASHRKQVVVLKQIQNKSIELDLETVFVRAILDAANRILPLKKSEPVGNRIVKFLATYTASLLEDDKKQAREVDEVDAKSFNERLVEAFISHFMRGLEASNKNVRYRSLQLLSYLLFQLEELDGKIFDQLMELLNDRLHDKDPIVRAAAIRVIAKFQDEDDDGSSDVSEPAEKLLIAIQNDPSADVRKAALLSLEKNGITTNYLIERARDTNATNRRLVFTRIMKKVDDFRTVAFEVREKLLTWGLRDREPSVANAAARMFAYDWFETCDNDLMALLGRLHVAESEIAELAMKVFFQQRSDIYPKISFSEDLWKALTPESAFLIRCYFQYSNEKNFTGSIDKNFPEAIELAGLLSKYLKLKKSFVEKQESDSNIESLDFVIQQLLIVAKDYDYSDEVGRREMFQVARLSLSSDFLSDKLIKETLQVLRKISISERDFCQMVTEVITDIKDSALDEIEGAQNEEQDDEEETFHSALSDIGNKSKERSRLVESTTIHGDDDEAENARPTKKPKLNQEKLDEITLQCLIITKRMLELTTEPLKTHFSIRSLIDTLIRPAIQSSLIQIRSIGIQCLGLACLIDKQLSAESMYLFGVCAAQFEDELKVVALKVIFDILSIHGTAGVLDIEDGVDSISLSKLLYRSLRNSEKMTVQSTTAIGICKLYLADILIDDELFETLLLAYFGPKIFENEVFKQALSFCIPVYSFSHSTHQEKVMNIASDTFLRMYQSYENDVTDEERSRMTPPSKILEQLIHFTDPSNVVNQSGVQIASSPMHAKLAIDLLALVNHEDFYENKSFKKTILTSLPKLKITSQVSLEVLKTLIQSLETCATQISEDSNGFDLVTRNAFTKFKTLVETLTNEAETIAEQDENKGNTFNGKAEEESEEIDLEKVVEEEIERSMIEPKEDEDSEEGEDNGVEDASQEEDENLLDEVSALPGIEEVPESVTASVRRRGRFALSKAAAEDSDMSE